MTAQHDEARYSVIVNQLDVQELLLTLAKDAHLNIDIHPGIQGKISLRASQQPIENILERISRQVALRWELDGDHLSVLPDTPYLKSYPVNYVNMNRETSGYVLVTTQIATAGSSGGSANTAGNNSLTRVENKAQHHFWERLEKNLNDILQEQDEKLPGNNSLSIVQKNEQSNANLSGFSTTAISKKTTNQNNNGTTYKNPLTATALDSEAETSSTVTSQKITVREAASVIVSPEAGLVTIRATRKQHSKVQEYIDLVTTSARRQVLIEATLAEVQLSSGYQQGIEWSAAGLGRAGFTLKQAASGSTSVPSASFFELGYSNSASRLGAFASTLRFLEEFGKVTVLSSPKLAVLNNQTAVLKVIDNQVYFTIKADVSQNQTSSITTYTTTLNSVPVGLVMNITPQIAGDNSVLLSVRPSISRVIGSVADPNPALRKSSSNGLSSDIVSEIPVIRTREMESVIRLENHNIGVMGGLMEDSQESTTQGIPGLAQIPLLGGLFRNKEDTKRKTELVVLLRPTVIQDIFTAATSPLPHVSAQPAENSPSLPMDKP